jgi:hypothetical protein
MKNTFLVIIAIACFSYVNAQSNCLLNGDFVTINNNCGDLCGGYPSIAGSGTVGTCVPNWFPVEGSPQVFGTNGSVWNYAYIWARKMKKPDNSYEWSRESIYTEFSFRKNITYTIKFRVAGYNGSNNYATLQDNFSFYLVNGLQPTLTNGCGGAPILNSSNSKLVVTLPGNSVSSSFAVFTYTVTPDRDYSQLFIYPNTSAVSILGAVNNQFNLLIDYVYVQCGDPCSGNMFITTSPIESGESKAANIIAGSQNTNTVINSTTANTILTGSTSVQLVPNINVTASGSYYFQARIQGCTAQSISDETMVYEEAPEIDSTEERMPHLSTMPVYGSKKIITVYPNPANKYIILGLGDMKGDIDITILNSVGIIMQRRKIIYQREGKTDNIHFDISTLPIGVYVIHARDNEKTANATVAVQR